MPALVTVNRLSKCYGANQAVHEVSFSIGRGEIFGLLGPNGAGKTTTLECLAGLREPDAGEIAIGGFDGRKHPRELKQIIGVVLQDTSLPNKITPREALRLCSSLYRSPYPTEPLLDRFELAAKADSPCETLSGGERQRLALALAFVNQPEFFLLDEPTAGLDPATRRAVHEEILRLRQEGRAVLLSTHFVEEAEFLCDRLAIVDHGRIVAIGEPHALVAGSGARLTVTIVSTPPLSRAGLAQLPGWVGPDTREGVRFQTDDAPATLAGIAALLREEAATLVSLQVKQTSLEEVFLRLTRAAGPATPR